MNGKYEIIEDGRAILLTLLSFIGAISIAFFIVINISPFFITLPEHMLGISQRALLTDYLRVIAYLQIPSFHNLELKSIPITKVAVNHFGDVKKIVLFNELILIVVIPLVISLLKKQKRRNQLWRLILPFQMLFILLVFGIFISLTNFNSYFIRFHYLIFSNMNWVFNPTSDPIILLMPENFFELLFGLWAFIAIVIIVLLWGWIKLTLRVFFNKS